MLVVIFEYLIGQLHWKHQISLCQIKFFGKLVQKNLHKVLWFKLKLA
jgi:hypothetical protein